MLLYALVLPIHAVEAHGFVLYRLRIRLGLLDLCQYLICIRRLHPFQLCFYRLKHARGLIYLDAVFLNFLFQERRFFFRHLCGLVCGLVRKALLL